MRFEVPDVLLAQLRAHFKRRDPTEEREDAFLLDPGLGPSRYLTRDGRVLIDGSGWDDIPIREVTDAEAISAIVIGARKTGISDLLSLLPRRSETARSCSRCHGSGWNHVSEATFVCRECHGLGWT